MSNKLIDNKEVMKEWDYKKNNDIKIFPETLTTGSNKKVWWICKNGHEYQRLVQNQRKGSGKCPICKSK